MEGIRIGFVLAAVAVLAACAKSQVPTSYRPSAGPFIGVDASKLKEPQRSLIAQATLDFDRVRQGLPPTCKTKPDSGFSDGGTLIYQCKHYRLTVMKGLYTLQGVQGYLYGPILAFDEDYSVSDVRFYSNEQLSKLLGRQ